MKTLDRPLDDDDRAMADLAEVADWRRISGPIGQSGRDLVLPLIKRVSKATGWRPWPVSRHTVIDDLLDGWGFLTRRQTEMAVYGDQVLPHSPFAGWIAYEIGPDDIAAAEAGLDENWPKKLQLATRHWGPPVYVGSDHGTSFVDEYAPGAGLDRRHLAVWTRPGAQIHLYSNKPTKDPLVVSVGINYSVYLNGEWT